MGWGELKESLSRLFDFFFFFPSSLWLKQGMLIGEYASLGLRDSLIRTNHFDCKVKKKKVFFANLLGNNNAFSWSIFSCSLHLCVWLKMNVTLSTEGSYHITE